MILIVAMGVVLCSPYYVMSSSSSSTAVQRNLYSHDLLEEGKNETRLHEAVRSGSIERVSLVCQGMSKSKLDKLNDNASLATIKSGGNASEGSHLKEIPGFAPIHLAILLKNPAVVEALLSAGAYVNCLGGLPNLKAVVTPLYFMLVDQFFNPQVLQILLDRGAYFFYPVLSARSGGITIDYSVFDILISSQEFFIEEENERIRASDEISDFFPLLKLLIQNPLSPNNVQTLFEAVIDTTSEPIPLFKVIKQAPERAMKGIAKKSYRLFAPNKKSLKKVYQRVRSFLKDRMQNSLFQNAELSVHIEALVSSDTMSDDFALIVLDFLTNAHGDPKDIFGSIDQKVIQTLLLSTSSQEIVTSFLVNKLKNTFEEPIAQHEKNEKNKKSWWRSTSSKKTLTAERISLLDSTTVHERYGALIKEGIEQRCSELNPSLASTTSSVDTHDYDLDDALSSDDST